MYRGPRAPPLWVPQEVRKQGWWSDFHLPDGEQLRVGGGVAAGLHQVVRAADNLAPGHQHRAHRHLAQPGGLRRVSMLPQRELERFACQV